MRSRLDLFAWAALTLVVLAAPARAQDACSACHATLADPRLRGPVAQVAESAHRGAEIGCAACHGGRRAEPTVLAHDPAAGFLARPAANVIPERCGGCHADARFMRWRGTSLPTDQLALFRQDPHGRALARGVTGAATCVSCHGAHDVRPSYDPASRTHATRVAPLCGECHRESTRRDGTHGTPVPDWQRSAHGEVFARGETTTAPTCTGCHGRHGELADNGGAAAACGRCHVEEASLFARSPHAAAWQRLGFGGCAACHGNHDVPPASDVLLGVGGRSACARCHAIGQRAWDLASRLSARRDEARARAARALRLVREAREAGIEPPGASLAVEEVREAESRLRVASHALDEAALDDAVRAVVAPSARAEDAARAAMARHRDERRTWLWMIPVLGVLLALLLVRIRRLDRVTAEGRDG